MQLTKPAGVFFQLIGFPIVFLAVPSTLVGLVWIFNGQPGGAYLIFGLAFSVLGIWMVKEGRQPAKRGGPGAETAKEPAPVENMITAKGGQFTYRVMAYRRMEKGELERTVLEALESGELKEPEPGGIATLVTDIGR
jgi:hypothetical protein